DYGTTWVYRNTDQLFMVPLRDDIESPFAPESDSEEWGDKKDDEDDEDEEKDDDDKKDEKVEDLEIDIEGFERRAVRIPVESGGFTLHVVNDDNRLIYTRNGAKPGDDPSIHILDLEDDEEEYEKSVLGGQGNFRISADGKKLLVWQNGRNARLAIIKAAEDQKTEDFIATSGMTAMIDPRAEWKQIFTDAWRIQRDYFYDGNMHGVDWPAVRTRYEAMLADCASRLDVSYVIGEMIAELNVGHAYYWGGDTEDAPSITVGMLGCDFERGDGAYRIVNILEGGAWDVDDRGPLSQPGVDVSNGDYLLAVNGVALDMKKDPWAAFQGMAGRTVTITVSDEPKMSDDARKIVVELLSSDFMLRYRAWVEKNRKYVEEKTGGRVGYIYVPNTGRNGQNELVRAFVGQKGKPALIIDERWNGGGQIPTRFVELLDRPIASYWATRFRDSDPAWPPDGHHGVKCMLINGNAGSGGDYFPYWFRERGLGKLIGTRTWGGLVGISGNPALIDGGYTSVPTFAFYEKDGTWGIEGHGVEPDIEVLDDPAKMVGGKDPQLDAAIAHILNELETNPVVHPKRPAYPDRSGMGITEQDK
ncbi:MAG: peptidase S41, partial [Gemmatimonadetes bacterium]|nr:peptidase S41 [Gemmatimonadota bacterium]